MSEEMESCRAITAIGYQIKQIKEFHKDLEILDEHLDFEYDDDHQELYEELERVRSKFAALEAKIIFEHEELEYELNPENTRVDGLRLDLRVILEEQKIIKNYENTENFKRYWNEILMLEKSTSALKMQYKLVRSNIRWDKGAIDD